MRDPIFVLSDGGMESGITPIVSKVDGYALYDRIKLEKYKADVIVFEHLDLAGKKAKVKFPSKSKKAYKKLKRYWGIK